MEMECLNNNNPELCDPPPVKTLLVCPNPTNFCSSSGSNSTITPGESEEQHPVQVAIRDGGEEEVDVPKSADVIVSPILDFWMEDEQLQGRFQVTAKSNSGQAIIFKIKTTSPYNFWVRPVYGLMKPNVSCWIEVKCDPNVSTARMAMDEFLVQIAPVPLATTAMTSDLYTSSVTSNLPELLSIWEKIDNLSAPRPLEAQKGIVEHRILTRFQGTLMKGSMKECNLGSAPSDCYLAREHTSEIKRDLEGEPRPRRSCDTVRQMQCVVSSLAVLLVGLLIYIFMFCIDTDGNLLSKKK